MIKSITVQPTCVAGGEVLSDVLNGLEQKQRKIVGFWFEQAADIRLRVYKNQERVIDCAGDCNQADYGMVPCDMSLEVGDTLKAGFQSDGATASAQYITCFFEEG